MSEKSSTVFPCPHCEARLEAEPEMLGSSLQCPSCEKEIKVPTLAGAVASSETESNEVTIKVPGWLAKRWPMILVAVVSLAVGMVLGGLMRGAPESVPSSTAFGDSKGEPYVRGGERRLDGWDRGSSTGTQTPPRNPYGRSPSSGAESTTPTRNPYGGVIFP